MAFHIHQMMAVIVTDIGGGGLSDGDGGHINLNFPSALHWLNLSLYCLVALQYRILKHFMMLPRQPTQIRKVRSPSDWPYVSTAT